MPEGTGLGLSVAQGVFSALDADRMNDAILAETQAARRAASVQGRQRAQQAGARIAQEREEASVARGRVAASAAARGIGVGSVATRDITNRISAVEGTNIDLIREGLDNETKALAEEVRLIRERNNFRTRDPVFAGVQGALGGASTGLNLGTNAGAALEGTQLGSFLGF